MKSNQTHISSFVRRIAALFLAILTLLLASVSCAQGTEGGNESPSESSSDNVSDSSGSTESGSETDATLPLLWKNAIYTEDQTFGEGQKAFQVEVVADGYSVTFTVKSDEEYVGAALLAHSLVVGENGPYGLYITVVNGITADYSLDQSYWSISKNGEYLMTGADSTPIENGAHYELTYTKG